MKEKKRKPKTLLNNFKRIDQSLFTFYPLFSPLNLELKEFI